MSNKHRKDKKQDAPTTTFGQLLKNAITEPFIKKPALPQKKSVPDDRPANQKSAAAAAVSSKPIQEPVKSALLNPTGRGATAEKKIIVAAPFADKIKPGDRPVRPEEIKKATAAPSSSATKAESSSRRSEQPRPFAGHLELMREKFWQNIEGESPNGSDTKKRAMRINLGIDLGTSCTKIVCRFGTESFPVCFGSNGNKIDDYLVPSVVALGKTKMRCTFEMESTDNLNIRLIPNFKICLTCESANDKTCSIGQCKLSNFKQGFLPDEVRCDEAAFLTTFYLAKLLVRAREMVRRQLHRRGYPLDLCIKWSANMAVPDKFAQSDVAIGFKTALEKAWLMSEIVSPEIQLYKIADAVGCYLAASHLREEISAELKAANKDFDCFIYSEIGAEVASVTLSPTAEEGLYAFVDVGAGTVDASVFRFFRSDEGAERIPYAASLFKLGAANIESETSKKFARKSAACFKKIKESPDAHAAIQQLLPDITRMLEEAAEEIGEKAKIELIEVFKEAFSKESNTERWKNLKLVLGGGGASLPAYQAAARYAFSIKGAGTEGEPKLTVLKVPKDFQMGTLPVITFHRFAVAYGLSREIIDLPEIVAPGQVHPTVQLRQRVYIDPTKDD